MMLSARSIMRGPPSPFAKTSGLHSGTRSKAMVDPARRSGEITMSPDQRNSGGLALELMHGGGRRAVDGNSPRFHRLRNFPDQFDLEKTVLERCVLHLNIVGQVELPLEGP